MRQMSRSYREEPSEIVSPEHYRSHSEKSVFKFIDAPVGNRFWKHACDTSEFGFRGNDDTLNGEVKVKIEEVLNY
jgi:hypothetical protein